MATTSHVRVKEGYVLVGDVASVWTGALPRKVGVLFGWELEAADGRTWAASARKQCFEQGFGGGEVELRFHLDSRNGAYVELRGVGELFSPIVADGSTHPVGVLVKGSGSLWLQTETGQSALI